MKLNDLQHLIDNNINHSSENELVVLTQGLSGSCVKVKSIWPGFDWYSNKIVITPETPLLNYDIKKLQRLRELYLKEVSKITFGVEKIWIAKYKKETKSFDRDFDAKIWVREKLKEELEDKN